MLTEYKEEFEKTIPYKYLTKNIVRDFEGYLIENDIPLSDAYNHIIPFSETQCIVSRKTQRGYRTRLRRFIEYIYEKEGIPQTNEGKMIIKG